MSDLRYRSAKDLREIIRAQESYRAALKAEWEQKEAEAAELVKQADDARRRWHNSGQRLTWARIYLARKEG